MSHPREKFGKSDLILTNDNHLSAYHITPEHITHHGLPISQREIKTETRYSEVREMLQLGAVSALLEVAGTPVHFINLGALSKQQPYWGDDCTFNVDHADFLLQPWKIEHDFIIATDGCLDPTNKAFAYRIDVNLVERIGCIDLKKDEWNRALPLIKFSVPAAAIPEPEPKPFPDLGCFCFLVNLGALKGHTKK
ncbi:MAG: hypothetical protein KC431_00100 [Myxococcales bacterium]|nr:hypothetical protein [Myxococcales bacterium]